MSTELCAIPYQAIWNLSLPLSKQEHNTSVQEVYDTYGDKGLCSLWVMQGFWNLEVRPSNGLTPAIEWWLGEDNPYADRMQLLLADNTIEVQAQASLQSATLAPKLGPKYLHPDQCTLNSLFAQFEYLDSSHVHAIAVRELAKRFYPQYPNLATPLNSLYFRTYRDSNDEYSLEENDDIDNEVDVYTHIMDAFLDDPHALKYLVSLGESISQNAPAWLRVFEKNKDPEWKLYEHMGLPLVNAYLFAKNGVSPLISHTLPEELTPMHGL